MAWRYERASRRRGDVRIDLIEDSDPENPKGETLTFGFQASDFIVDPASGGPDPNRSLVNRRLDFRAMVKREVVATLARLNAADNETDASEEFRP